MYLEPDAKARQEHSDLAERNSRLTKDLRKATEQVAESQQQLKTHEKGSLDLNARLADLTTELADSRRQREALQEALATVQEEAQVLQQTLDGTHKTHHRTVSDLQEVMKEMREAPERGEPQPRLLPA